MENNHIFELRAMLLYIHSRIGDFYNKGLYKDNPTRKEIFFILKEIKNVLEKTKN